MPEPIWITKTMVEVIHDDQIAEHGGSYGMLNSGMLSSALARSQNLYAYGKPDLYQLAAAYGYGIVKNHPFVDGNKRTAFQVMFVFLKINGRNLEIPEPEVVITMRDIAAGVVSELQLAEWLRQHC